MRAPFEYVGHGDVCMGCVEVIATGDTVAPVAGDRPERLLCLACWWLQECGLTLPRWTRAGGGPRPPRGSVQARQARLR